VRGHRVRGHRVRGHRVRGHRVRGHRVRGHRTLRGDGRYRCRERTGGLRVYLVPVRWVLVSWVLVSWVLVSGVLEALGVAGWIACGRVTPVTGSVWALWHSRLLSRMFVAAP
jgi:hypothetical protein